MYVSSQPPPLLDEVESRVEVAAARDRCSDPFPSPFSDREPRPVRRGDAPPGGPGPLCRIDQAGRIHALRSAGPRALEVFGPPNGHGTSRQGGPVLGPPGRRPLLFSFCTRRIADGEGLVARRLNGVKCLAVIYARSAISLPRPAKDTVFPQPSLASSREQRSDVRRPDCSARPCPAWSRRGPNQGRMLHVTAKVTLTPSELREYRRLECSATRSRAGFSIARRQGQKQIAIRLVWDEMTGERLSLPFRYRGRSRWPAVAFNSPQRGASSNRFSARTVVGRRRRRSPVSSGRARTSLARAGGRGVTESRPGKGYLRRMPRMTLLASRPARGDPAEASLPPPVRSPGPWARQRGLVAR